MATLVPPPITATLVPPPITATLVQQLSTECEKLKIPCTPRKLKLIAFVLKECLVASGVKLHDIPLFFTRLREILTGNVVFSRKIAGAKEVDVAFLREYLMITGTPPADDVRFTTYLDGTLLSVRQRFINVILDSSNPTGTTAGSLKGLFKVYATDYNIPKGTADPFNELEDMLTGLFIVGATGAGVEARVKQQKQRARDETKYDALHSSMERGTKRTQDAEPHNPRLSFPLVSLPAAWLGFAEAEKGIIVEMLEFGLGVVPMSLIHQHEGGPASSAGALQAQRWLAQSDKPTPPNVPTALMELWLKSKMDGHGAGADANSSSSSGSSSSSSSSSSATTNTTNTTTTTTTGPSSPVRYKASETFQGFIHPDIPLRTLLVMAAQLLHTFEDPELNHSVITYQEYNGFTPETEEETVAMTDRTHASTGFEGRIWKFARNWEDEHESPHVPSSLSLATSWMTFVFNIVNEQMLIQHSSSPTISFIFALTPNTALEGSGYPLGGASTMTRTCEEAIRTFKTSFATWKQEEEGNVSQNVTMQMVRMEYLNNDVKCPAFFVQFEDTPVYLQSSDVLVRLGNGSLRGSKFPGRQDFIRQASDELEMDELNQTVFEDEQAVYGCAVRVRGLEAQQGLYLDASENPVVPMQVHFIGIQLHRHCLSIFQLILPFYEMGFLAKYEE